MLPLRALAFGATMFASSALNNLFVTYYIVYFTTIVKIPHVSFFLGQIGFMIWNSFNDLLFGWLSDHCCHRRTRRSDAIRVGGAVWSMAFAVLWLPLPSLTPQPDITIFGLTWHEIASTFHFLAVLCLYDGGLTFTEVNHSALLAEMTSSPSERAECNMWSAVCAGCGALTSWIAYVTWDPVDLTHFRASTLCVAGLAWIVFETSGRITARFIVGGPVSTATAVVEDDSGAVIEDEAERRPVSPRDRKSSVSKSVTQSPSRDSDVGQSFIGFLLQLLRRRNFFVFVVMSSLQVFDCTFEKNFFALSLDYLAGPSVSAGVKGLVISSSFILPHICTVFITPIIQKRGLHEGLTVIFLLRGVILLLASLIGSSSPYVVCMFLLINRVTSESVCRLTPLIVSDLIDEDTFVNNRSSPLSASVAGAAAFFPKFGQSIAPMLGIALLPSSFANDSAAHSSLWTILILLPTITVGTQITLWTGLYTLKGAYLKTIKVVDKVVDQ